MQESLHAESAGHGAKSAEQQRPVVIPALRGIVAQRLWCLQLCGMAVLLAIPGANLAGMAMVAARFRAGGEGPLLRAFGMRDFARGTLLVLLELGLAVLLLALLGPAFDTAAVWGIQERCSYILLGAWVVPSAAASAAGLPSLHAMALRLAAVYATCLVSVAAAAICMGRAAARAFASSRGFRGAVYRATCLPLLTYTAAELLVLTAAQPALAAACGIEAAALLTVATAVIGLATARCVCSAAIARALRAAQPSSGERQPAKKAGWTKTMREVVL